MPAGTQPCPEPCGRQRASLRRRRILWREGPRNDESALLMGASGVPPRGFELRRPWLYQATFRSGKRNPCRWTPLDPARLRRAFSPNFHPPVTAQPVALGECVLASGRRATSPSSVLAVVGARADGALADRPEREPPRVRWGRPHPPPKGEFGVSRLVALQRAGLAGHRRGEDSQGGDAGQVPVRGSPSDTLVSSGDMTNR
jgi:hypothetical protein